jgi:hypothetical protein
MGPSTERDLLTHIPHPLCGADRTLTARCGRVSEHPISDELLVLER